MAIIDFANREIIAKIIYFGAVHAGVSTNVRQLHSLVGDRTRSELRHFGTGDEDALTWCFDYNPDDTGALPFDLRMRVFSLQSGLVWESHRDDVLAGTDAVVFVADARAERGPANRAAMLELEYSLARQDLELAAVPMVIQVNHTDAANARPPDRVVAGLNPHGFPVVPSVARDGRGVLSTHNEAEGATLARLRDNLAGDRALMSLTRVTLGQRQRDQDVISRHLANIDRDGDTVTTPGFSSHGAPATEFHVHPVGMSGLRPIEVVRSELRGDRIFVDFLAEDLKDGGGRRAMVVVDLAPDGADSEDTGRYRAVTATPDVDTLVPAPSSMWLGFIGLVGGILCGILVGFLVFG